MQHVNLAYFGGRRVNLRATRKGPIMEQFVDEFWLMCSGFIKGIFINW